MGMIAPKKENIGRKIFVFLFILIFLPFLLLYVFFYLGWGIVLCSAIWLTWGRRDILFIYSNSPIWKDYIESQIIPYIEKRAVILNWSERKNWKNSLAVHAFRYFGGDRNFNPMAVVLRPFRFPKTHRFYEAFKDFKHGKPRKVEELRTRVFRDLGI